ncbi:Molybdopterin synthase catalytic subunit [Botryosphaeria dothidea]
MPLTYTSYAPLALTTLLGLARAVRAAHALTAVAVAHRLGTVPIGEESILIAVSAPHRQAAWRGGEEALEVCKEKVEIWKLEEFADEEGGVWRANRDGAMGVRVGGEEEEEGEGKGKGKGNAG